MSGVIDHDGQQWEHCGVCQEFVRIQDLLYEEPSTQFPHGLDICENCAALPLPQRVVIARRESTRRAIESYERYVEMGWDVTLNADNSISIHSTGKSN